MTDEEEYTAEPIGEPWDNPWVLGMMAGGLGVLVLTLVGIAFGLVVQWIRHGPGLTL